MNPLRQALEKYLSLRRALGFELYRPGKALERFVSFAEQEGASTITTALALRWARLPEGVDPSTWAGRLDLVRRFARFCYTLDLRTEVPPDGLLPHRLRRKTPYIWSRAEVKALLALMRRIRSPLGLRRFTYETFFGLISGAGLRISEALGLDNADIDWSTGVVTIRNTKFGKTRRVPVHPSTLVALQQYARKRDRLVPTRDREAYFITEQGSRLSQGAVRWVYQSLRKQLEFGRTNGHRPPRIHDLRHAFAVETLRRWYRAGRDVEAWLPRLATYMGHAHVNDTYWYLSAVPDLLSSAARRMDQVKWRCTP
jgi:integrase/recombinase XerD